MARLQQTHILGHYTYRASPPSPPTPQPDPKPKPPTCGFCPGEGTKHPDCIVASCAKHERAAWRLNSCLGYGGVSDTPELRQEILRKVAASDAHIASEQLAATGARTLRDYRHPYTRIDDPNSVCHGTSKPYPDTVTTMKPPPEEIPLVGETPHYEWP